MPLPRHAQGRPGTDVIPDDWQDTHAPVLAKTRKATVDLRRARTTRTAADPYAADQAARIQALVAGRSGGSDQEVAGETVYVRGYLVTLDVATTAMVGDLVDVTACRDDPMLPGKTLRVDGVVRGSQLFERDLLCTLDN